MSTSDIAAFLIPLGTGIIALAVTMIYSRKTRKQREIPLISRIRQTGEEELEKVRLLQIQVKVRMRSQHEAIKNRQEAFL